MALLSPPRVSSDNAADLLLEYPELDCQFGLLDVAECVSSPDLVDLLLGEPRHAVTTSGVVGHHGATLAVSIPVVVSLRAEEPMAVVVTGRVVAGVQDEESLGDRTNSMLVPPSGRGDHLRAATGAVGAILKESVWTTTETASPDPTLIGPAPVDLRPVALFKCETSTHNADYNDWMLG